MSLKPEWTEEIDTVPDAIQYHPSPGLLVVGTDTEGSSGPRIELLSAAEGTARGSIETTGALRETEYDPTSGTLFAITDDDHVYAIDPERGSRLWDAWAASVATVADERVFLSADRTLWAYDISDGSRKWQTTLPDSVAGQIAQLAGTLLVGVGDSSIERVVAVDPATGEEQWDYERERSIREAWFTDHGVYAQISARDELVRIATDAEATGADDQAVSPLFDPAAGTEQWSYSLNDGSVLGTIVSVFPRSERVYVKESGTVSALDPESGSKIWQSPEYDSFEFFSIAGEALYGVVETADDSRFVRLDPDSGRAMWETEIRTTTTVTDGLEGDGGRLYVGTRETHRDGSIVEDGPAAYQLNAVTGRIDWTFETDERVAWIAGDGDPVIVGEEASQIHGVDADSGRQQWSSSGEYLHFEAASDRRVVVVGTGDEKDLHVLDRADGTVEFATTSEVYHTGGGALFASSGTAIEAYPIASQPAVFASPDDRSGTNTEVYPSSGESSGETDVYEAREADAKEAAGWTDGETTAVSYCPNCGTDLAAFGDVNFCPECGADLSTE
jgi:outer membrane protein assembly factor BamB